MKKLLFIASTVLLLSGPAFARNIAIPSDDPAAVVTVPDNWKFEEIEYGYSAISPNKDVFFSIESAKANKVDAMMKNNDAWMKDNGIDATVTAKKQEGNFGGFPATIYTFDTKDDDGPTTVEFVLVPAGKERVIFLTLYGSEEERAKHKTEIEGIVGSFKAIN